MNLIGTIAASIMAINKLRKSLLDDLEQGSIYRAGRKTYLAFVKKVLEEYGRQIDYCVSVIGRILAQRPEDVP